MRLLVVLLTVMTASAQVWRSGDNSTVKGCSETCSTEGAGDLSCWQDSLSFFETQLITQLRHYIANQVDIDQWHRRHGSPKGQDFDKVAEQIQKDFLGQLRSVADGEVLEAKTANKTASILSGRIREIATHSMDKVPLYQCPLPCDYTFDMYKIIFATSMVLNGVLAVAIIPSFIRSLRSEDEPEKQPLQPSVDRS